MQRLDIPTDQVAKHILILTKILSVGALILTMILTTVLVLQNNFHLDLYYYRVIHQDPIPFALLIFAIVTWFSRNSVAGWIFQKVRDKNQDRPDLVPYQKYMSTHLLKIWMMESAVLAGFLIAHFSHNAGAFLMFAALQVVNILLDFPTDERVRHRIQMLTERTP